MTDLPVQPPTLSSARAMRDGGIDAMAALDTALWDALAGVPADRAAALKHAFGVAMGEISLELIAPAIRAFPELAVNDEEWSAIARERARLRGIGVLPACNPPDILAANDHNNGAA